MLIMAAATFTCKRNVFMYCLVAGFVICNLLSTPCNANVDSDALIAVKSLLHDPNNVLQTWEPNSVDACTWIHVTCDNDKRVTRVDLGQASLSGTLSARIGDLAKLQFLHLFSNSLSGSLPSSLGNLKNLNALHLAGNKFTGRIPDSLGGLSNLRILFLYNNQLSGPVPTSLSRFGFDSFKGNPGLCGAVVRKKC